MTTVYEFCKHFDLDDVTVDEALDKSEPIRLFGTNHRTLYSGALDNMPVGVAGRETIASLCDKNTALIIVEP